MFVYSLRASGIKIFALAAVALALVLVIVFSGKGVAASSGAEGVELSGIKTEEDRREFLESLGIKVKAGEPVETVAFVMPENFDRVMLGYNEIQKSQGFDLSKYAKKRVTRYTYELENYDGYDGTVYVNILVYRSRIIGADISSADPEGFIEPLIK